MTHPCRFLLSFALLSFCIPISPAFSLPGNSVQEVRLQLRRSSLFTGEHYMHRNAQGDQRAMDTRSVFVSVDGQRELQGFPIAFRNIFSGGVSQSESLVIEGPTTDIEITRESRLGRSFIADLWGEAVQKDFENSRFIREISKNDCDSEVIARLNVKVFQGGLYFYEVSSRDFLRSSRGRNHVEFSVGRLSDLPNLLDNMDTEYLCQPWLRW